MKKSKFICSYWLLLVLPVFVGCDTVAPEAVEPPLTLNKPSLEIEELTAKDVKFKWDNVDQADYYQLNTYLMIPGGYQEVDMNIVGDNYMDYQYFYCGDSMRVILYATAQEENGNYVSSEPDTVAFRFPACEYELTARDTSVPAYCGGAYEDFKVDLKNITYDFTDFSEEHLQVDVTSNISQYDPAASDLLGLSFHTGQHYYYVVPPYIDPSLCDNDPDTDIISINLSVKYRKTDEHIPGSPMQFEVAIK